MFKIYPYKQGSSSVKKLKTALDAIEVKLVNSHCRYRLGQTIINWGNSGRPSWMTTDVPVLNSPEAVAIASNKTATLQKLNDEFVQTVNWTDEKDIAEEWLSDGAKIFVRHIETGHSGEGIEVIEGTTSLQRLDIADELNDLFSEYYESTENESERNLLRQLNITLGAHGEVPAVNQLILPDAPLYTVAIDNHGEYRVHVFNGEVILYQKKSRRVSEDGFAEIAEGEDADVRNLASNWVYRTGNLRRLERVEELAVSAVEALGLDFGAVDIIKDENGEVYVLEVNTAPGLGNEDTLDAYIRAFNGEPPVLPDEITVDA